MYRPSRIEHDAARDAIAKKLRGRDEGEIQDVLIKALEKFDAAKGVPFVAFAYGIAENFAKRRQRAHEELPTEVASNGVDVDAQLDARRRLEDPSVQRLARAQGERGEQLGKRYRSAAALLAAVSQVAEAEYEQLLGTPFTGGPVQWRWCADGWEEAERAARGIWSDLRKSLRGGQPVRVSRELRRVLAFARSTTGGARIAVTLRFLAGENAQGALPFEDSAWLAANIAPFRTAIDGLNERMPKDPRTDVLRPPSLAEWLRRWDGRFPFNGPPSARAMALASVLAGVPIDVDKKQLRRGLTVATILEQRADAVTKARERLGKR